MRSLGQCQSRPHASLAGRCVMLSVWLCCVGENLFCSSPIVFLERVGENCAAGFGARSASALCRHASHISVFEGMIVGRL